MQIAFLFNLSVSRRCRAAKGASTVEWFPR